MHILDAEAADLPAIVAIYNQTIASRMSTADLEPVTVEQRQEWFHAHAPGVRPLWVARESLGGPVLAWLSFHAFRNRQAYDITAEIGIYVDTKARRTGLGRMLLERAVRQAPQLGMRNLVGLIFGHNTPSLILFEQCGFTRWGTLPRVALLDGHERDVVILGRRVG